MQKRKSLRLILTGAFLMLALFFVFQSPVMAQNTGDNAVFGGDAVRQSTAEALGNPVEKDPRDIAANIINIVFGFLGLLTVSYVLYGGYLWMTSGGQPEKIQHAKDVLKNTVIGLLIILSAYAIVMFIFRMFFGVPPVGDGGGGPGRRGAGIGALGNGILVSVYPAPNQTDVPRNTGIIVTFRESILPSSVCATSSVASSCAGEDIATTTDSMNKNIRIYFTKDGKACEKTTLTTAADANKCKLYEAKVYSTDDNKTFVFKPKEYLGSPSEFIWHTVYLTRGIKKANGDDAFKTYEGVRDTSWSFEVSNKLDLTPPVVSFGQLFPAPDNIQDQKDTATALLKMATAEVVLETTSLKSEVIATTTQILYNNVASPDSRASFNDDCKINEFNISVNDSGGATIYVGRSTTTSAGADVGGNMGQGKLSSDNKSVTFEACGFKLTPKESLLTVGNSWKIKVTPYQLPSRLLIGSRTYTAANIESVAAMTFKSSTILNESANSLIAVINADESGPATSSLAGANKLLIGARTQGVIGNNISIDTNDTTAIRIGSGATSLSGGADAVTTVIVKSRKDKPRNSLVQINFNEAINPSMVSGSSSQVSNYIRAVNASTTALVAGAVCYEDNQCKSLVCKKAQNAQPKDAGVCFGAYLSGKFKISNQYKTVEFSSDNQCGVNGCGEKIYCLPGDANIKIELIAASLETCASAVADCATRQPYIKCDKVVPTGFSPAILPNNVCQNQSSTTFPINFPAGNLDGIMDICFNSLDGNRDASSQGASAAIFYKENSVWGECQSGNMKDKVCSQDNRIAICGTGINCNNATSTSEAQKFGDNYNFSFWTNNEILSGAPYIKELENAKIKDSGVNVLKPIVMNFDRVMSASTLSNGSVAVDLGATSTIHRLLNLGAFSTVTVGYWGMSEPQDVSPQDGEMDWTKGMIAHTDFDPSMDYWAEVGSGVKDIYQNCYKPSNGPISNASTNKCGATPDAPTCCNGATSTAAYCPLNALK